MQVTVGSRRPLEQAVDTLVVALGKVEPEHWRPPARLAPVDRALGGRISAVVASGDFRGRKGETLLLYPEPESDVGRVLLLGLGPEEELGPDTLRELAGTAVRGAQQRHSRSLALVAPSPRRLRPPAVATALAEGAILAGYRFDRYKAPEKDEATRLESVRLLFERGVELRPVRAAASAGVHLAESQNLARDLSNEPPNALPPVALARAAQKMAREVGLRIRVLGPADLRRHELGAMLAVAQGSQNPPRLIVLEHNAPPRSGKATRRRRTVCLIGKGVTFDSGGLSLKPSTSMVKMKHDMSGGAAVIGAMRAAALLKVPLHVVGIIGAVENMPSGTAYRPDDIVTSGSGKTVEITNTDAEGRLVLADALHFAQTEFSPAAMVDVATLTGACAIALGSWAAAVLSNNEQLSELVIKAGEAAGERFWPLPLWDVHREHMRSRIADVRQTGGREGGTITAAAFLSHFVGDVPWAHLDIASVADTDAATALQPRGATGFGVRTLVELLRGSQMAKIGS